MPYVRAAGRALEYEWIGVGGASGATLVFLHEGLGSAAQWRDFPLQVATRTGRRALVYSRYGHGQSEVPREARRSVRFMHEEALDSLPEVLKGLGVQNPILVGHSDGASIALIHAGAGHPVRGLALMAPHVFVEDLCIRSIEQAKRDFETTDLPRRLAKYHKDAAKTFFLWNDVWLDPEFRPWNIAEFLPAIRCPVLAIQGEDDAYGTMAQLEAVKEKVNATCELVKLPACGHAPFRDRPRETLEAVVRFVEALP